MKNLTVFALFATLLAAFATPSEARDRYDDDRYERHDRYRDDRRDRDDYRRGDYRGRHHYRHVDRTRTVWVIEGRRPVKRVVYVDSRGQYFRRVSGRTVYVRERVFTSYPSRYYYSDGRPRAGIRITF